MLKIQQIFPKLYWFLLYVVFHNLEPQNAGLVVDKRDLRALRKIKGNFCARKSKKISIVIKNVIWSEKTLMHKAKRPSNYFSNSFIYNQAGQIKKGVICVQILLEIHLTEHGKFHFQGRTSFYTPVLITPSRHTMSK